MEIHFTLFIAHKSDISFVVCKKQQQTKKFIDDQPKYTWYDILWFYRLNKVQM